MKRRDFLFNSIKLSALFLLKSCGSLPSTQLLSPKQIFLLGDGKEDFSSYGDYTISKPVSTYLSITDSLGGNARIQTPCKAHEITLNPARASEVFATSKWGHEAYSANFHKKELLNTVIADKDSFFYGHSVFSQDGNFIFATMMNHEKNYGYISIRDNKTLKELKQIPTGGTFPHQLRWIQTDKIVAVLNALPADSTNEAEQYSTLNFIDVTNGKIIRSHKTSSRRHSHFTYLPEEDKAFIARSSSPKNADLFEMLNLKNNSITQASLKHFAPIEKTEALSHFLVEKDSLAFMTLTGHNKVLIWNYDFNKIIQTHEFSDSPRGIALSPDKKIIYVSFSGIEKATNDLNMYHYNAFFQQAPKPFATIKGGNGSHLCMV